jgi:hypothetical protein
MSARNVPRSSRPGRARGAAPERRGARLSRRARRWGVALLLAIHVALVVPGIFRNSITFDENFHLPAGALYLARGYTHVSLGQPPLARALYALPVMLAHPALPPDSVLGINAERAMAQSFLHLNAARFQTLYGIARFVALLLSLLTGLLVYRLARGLYGGAAGLLALAAWVAFPDVVAQAGLIAVDLPTALVNLLLILALRAVVRRGGAWPIARLTLAFGAALLIRYSTLELVPALVVLVVWAGWRGRQRHPWLAAWALVVAFVGGVVLLDLGYLGQVSWLPMGKRAFMSKSFHALGQRVPGLALPLPDAYIAGFDYLRALTEGIKPIFVFGHTRPHSVWWYFPVAVAVKWPIGLLGLLALRLAFVARHRPRRAWDEACLLLPALTVIGVAMASDLGFGVRYLLPAVPFLCVWAGGVLARPAARAARASVPRGWALAAVALAALETGECAAATPWQLSFYNAFAGGRGEWIVNDSNLDWGQGLLALRDELHARGIRRVHLAYHGTTDPALYGIDYIPYQGGLPGPESDWIAVSTYFWVGLPQRMVTPKGDTPFMAIDFRPLWAHPDAARPANCIHLIRLRGP